MLLVNSTFLAILENVEITPGRTLIEDQVSIIIPDNLAGRRLDQVLAELVPDFSRSQLQKWIKSGLVLVNGEKLRPRDNVLGGELVELAIEIDEQTNWQAEDIPISVIYEDEHILVVNKEPGMVVHPGAGNNSGTLSNALLHHIPQQAAIPRAGIVHRLDKDTSGLLVVAKSLTAHKNLVEQLQQRTVSREYTALCNGVMTAGGTVDEPIGRHPTNRLRMAVRENGKPAITHYRVAQRFRAHTLIQVKLETGRTHQIRVHMSYIRYPLVGDLVYGGRLRIPADCSEKFADMLKSFRRQALHASSLGLKHPLSGKEVHFTADLPQDLNALINAAQQDLDEHAKI